jgi:tripartite-type tricarboxylate transporter receptor subunit TctC
MRLRAVLSLVLLSAVSALPFASALAQRAFPDRPIRIIVPFTPGGSNDVLARALAPDLQARLGQPVVVENKPGAGGNIGIEYVAKSPADGHTLIVVSNGVTMTPWIQAELGYHPLRLAPVTIAVTLPMVVTVNTALPVRSAGELVAYAKTNPGKLSYATPGSGTPHHLAGELFKHLTGIEMVMVPYKGTAGIALDLIAGRVNVLFSALDTMRPHILAGKIRAIGIAERKRLAAFPDLPTIGETVPGFEVHFWLGLMAPEGTPQAVTDKLAEGIRAALSVPEVKARLENTGMIVEPTSPQAMGSIMKSDYEKWGKVVKAAGIQAK